MSASKKSTKIPVSAEEASIASDFKLALYYHRQALASLEISDGYNNPEFQYYCNFTKQGKRDKLKNVFTIDTKIATYLKSIFDPIKQDLEDMIVDPEFEKTPEKYTFAQFAEYVAALNEESQLNWLLHFGKIDEKTTTDLADKTIGPIVSTGGLPDVKTAATYIPAKFLRSGLAEVESYVKIPQTWKTFLETKAGEMFKFTMINVIYRLAGEIAVDHRFTKRSVTLEGVYFIIFRATRDGELPFADSMFEKITEDMQTIIATKAKKPKVERSSKKKKEKSADEASDEEPPKKSVKKVEKPAKTTKSSTKPEKAAAKPEKSTATKPEKSAASKSEGTAKKAKSEKADKPEKAEKPETKPKKASTKKPVKSLNTAKKVETDNEEEAVASDHSDKETDADDTEDNETAEEAVVSE